jgi:hypothetical protein
MSKSRSRLEKLNDKSRYGHYLSSSFTNVIRKKYSLKEEIGELEFKEDQVDVNIEKQYKQERGDFYCYLGYLTSANGDSERKVFKVAKYKNADWRSKIRAQLVAKHFAKEFSKFNKRFLLGKKLF